MVNLIKRIKSELQFKKAVDEAEKAHEKNGGRFYVLPNKNGKLLVLDRTNFRILKRKGYIKSNYNMNDVKRISFYYTSGQINDNMISDEEAALRKSFFLSWASKKKETV